MERTNNNLPKTCCWCGEARITHKVIHKVILGSNPLEDRIVCGLLKSTLELCEFSIQDNLITCKDCQQI